MDFPPHRANDAWSPGAYIRIVGPDGQLLYIGVMTEKEEDCVAHTCALQLLVVVVIRGYFSQLADVYRFLIMEVCQGREFHS